MTPYGYYSFDTALIHGPGFAPLPEDKELHPIYTEPCFPGHKPFACTFTGSNKWFDIRDLDHPDSADVLFPLYLWRTDLHSIILIL
jgi:hypothetical protein